MTLAAVSNARMRTHEERPIDDLKSRARRTVAMVIRDALRTDIVNLTLRPGEALNEKELGYLYRCSRTPVREALMKLAEERLIEIFPQSGTFVSRIPLAALPEALVIRRALEETAARLAGENTTQAGVTRIEAAMLSLEQAARNDDREAFHQYDEAFHAAIAGLAGYPGIWRLTQQVKLQVDRFRRLTLPQTGRMARVLLEHNAILDAIRRGAGYEAAAAMGDHLAKLLADLADVALAHPEFFDSGGSTLRPRIRTAASISNDGKSRHPTDGDSA